eukprot:GEMP01062525.1.p1 GENE.GEMP01062525.1~~GEMP01062525.1.p1  ORF type:complete len:199 (+),score=26.34 GEMP01062525.1:171-767(+)
MFQCVSNAARCCPKTDSHDIPFTTIFYGKERGPEPTAYAVAFARSSSFVARDNTAKLGSCGGIDPLILQAGGTDFHLLYEPDTQGFPDEDCDIDEGASAQQIRTVDEFQCGRPGTAFADTWAVTNERAVKTSELITRQHRKNGPDLQERNSNFPDTVDTSISVLTRMVDRQNQRSAAGAKPLSSKWKNRIVEGTVMHS